MCNQRRSSRSQCRPRALVASHRHAQLQLETELQNGCRLECNREHMHDMSAYQSSTTKHANHAASGVLKTGFRCNQTCLSIARILVSRCRPYINIYILVSRWPALEYRFPVYSSISCRCPAAGGRHKSKSQHVCTNHACYFFIERLSDVFLHSWDGMYMLCLYNATRH